MVNICKKTCVDAYKIYEIIPFKQVIYLSLAAFILGSIPVSVLAGLQHLHSYTLLAGISTFVISVVAMLCVYLCSRRKKPQIIEERQAPSNQISQSTETESWKRIKSGWKDNPKEEIERLRSIGILTDENMAAIDSYFSGVTEWFINAKKDLLTVTLGRALEIRAFYRKTHYVFTHGESDKRLIIPYLIKEMLREVISREELRFFKPLRLFSEDELRKFEQFRTNFFKQKGFAGSWKTDHNEDIRKYLLSVDGYFWNIADGESACDFLTCNTSMADIDPDALKDHISAVLKEAGFTTTQAENIASKLLPLTVKVTANLGNLFLICISKEHFDQDPSRFGYRSHSFGKPCQCHEGKDDRMILERLQNDQFDKETSCRDPTKPPQYRLFTPELRPENGVQIIMLSSVAKELRQEIKKTIRDCLAAEVTHG